MPSSISQSSVGSSSRARENAAWRQRLRPLLAPLRSVPTARPERDLSGTLVWPVFVGWLAIKCWLSWIRYFNKDCFECMHQGWLLHQGLEQYVDFKSNHPPLPFQVFGLLNYFTNDAVTLLYLGRVLVLISAIIVTWLVYRICRDVFGARAARWAVISHCACIMFIEYSTMIRMDAFMMPFWLGAIAVMVGRGPMPIMRRMFWVGLLAGLALWSNQKFVLLAIPSVIFAFSGGVSGKWRLRHWAVAFAGAMVPTGYYLGAAVWSGSLPQLIEGNLGSGADAMSEGLYAINHVRSLFAWLRRDPVSLVLMTATTCWGVFNWRGLSRSQRFLALSPCFIFSTLFITPCPFVYYVACLTPAICIGIGGFLGSRRIPQPKTFRSWAFCLAILCAALALPAVRLLRLSGASNDHQLQVVRLVNQLARPDDMIFDGSGIAITRPDAYGYDWILWKREEWKLRHGLQPQITPFLKANECRIVIENVRIQRLPQPDHTQIWSHYVQLWGPVFVPGFDSETSVGAEPIAFDLWFDGEYEFNVPTLIIDGQECTSPCFIAAGQHRVAVPDGTAQIIIRDATYRSRLLLPAESYPAKAVILP